MALNFWRRAATGEACVWGACQSIPLQPIPLGGVLYPANTQECSQTGDLPMRSSKKSMNTLTLADNTFALG